MFSCFLSKSHPAANQCLTPSPLASPSRCSPLSQPLLSLCSTGFPGVFIACFPPITSLSILQAFQHLPRKDHPKSGPRESPESAEPNPRTLGDLSDGAMQDLEFLFPLSSMTNVSHMEYGLPTQLSFSAREVSDGTFFRTTADYDPDSQRVMYQLEVWAGPDAAVGAGQGMQLCSARDRAISWTVKFARGWRYYSRYLPRATFKKSVSS